MPARSSVRTTLGLSLGVLLLSGSDAAWAACALSGTNQTCTNDITITGAPGGNGIEDTALLTLTNNGTISESAAGNSVFSADLFLTNNGSITAVDGSTYGVWATNAATVYNYGSITSNLSNAIISPDVTLFNYGTLSGSNAVSATTATISNYGTISGVNALGINTANVTNYGAINGEATAFFTGDVTLVNYGRITATGNTSIQNAVQSDTMNVVNYGTITAHSTGADTAVGLYVGAFVHTNPSTITNYGSIIAIGTTADATGVYGFAPLTLTNAGTISGRKNSGLTNAIFFQTAGGTLNILPGSTIIGGIGFTGAGNSVNIIGGNQNLTFQSLAGVTVGGTAPHVVSGTQVASVDTSPFTAITTMLMSMTRSISSLAPDDTAAESGMSAGSIVLDGTSFWLRGAGGHARGNSKGSLLSFSDTYYLGAVGFERPVNADLDVGGFIGGGNGTSKIQQNYGDISTDVAFAGAYMRRTFGTAFVKAGLQTGYGSNDSTRTMNNNTLPGGIETASADYDNWYVSPEVSVGRIFSLGETARGKLSLTPSARLRYIYNSSSGYTETGSTANMSVASIDSQTLEERLEMKLTHSAPVFGTYNLRTSLTGGFLGSQRLGDPGVDATLLSQPLHFTPPGENNAWGPLAGIGFELGNGSVTAFAAGEYIALPHSNRDLGGKAGLSLKF